MTKSTHKAEIVPVKLEPHSNADKLSIVKVWGYTVCVNTEQWKNKDRGAYIVPDSLVNTELPEFSFLNNGEKWVRIKVKKLRGIVSMGLLVPYNGEIGEDVSEKLDVRRYEPPIRIKMHGNNVSPPDIYTVKYDVDSWHRYNHVFKEGEPIYIFEKIHGASSRYVYHNDKQYCGSRSQWKAESASDPWWMAFYNDENIGKFCRDNPDIVLYGEVAGKVQNLNYGINGVKFFAFDILDHGRWLNVEEFLDYCNNYEINCVPIIDCNIPYNSNKVIEYAEGQSLIADHVREGCVIKPMIERTHPEIGRVCLKIVGNDYYNYKG